MTAEMILNVIVVVLSIIAAILIFWGIKNFLQYTDRLYERYLDNLRKK